VLKICGCVLEVRGRLSVVPLSLALALALQPCYFAIRLCSLYHALDSCYIVSLDSEILWMITLVLFQLSFLALRDVVRRLPSFQFIPSLADITPISPLHLRSQSSCTIHHASLFVAISPPS
jgi:hypothetical protein